MSYYLGLTSYNEILRVVRMELKVGDIFKCPEGHEARIVWIREDKKIVAVRCPQEHLSKVVKAVGHTNPTLSYRNQLRTEKKIYVRNMVFLIEI
jgi:hypothetical protein